MVRVLSALAAIVLVALGASAAIESPVAAQDGGQEGKTIWDGIYTVAQAERGEALFDIRCSHCHAEDLGGGEGPALVGSGFTRSWYGDSVHRLFTHILTSMPSDMPGTLSPDDALALTSFLLSENGFPAGSDRLESRADLLASILIVGEDGPGRTFRSCASWAA